MLKDLIALLFVAVLTVSALNFLTSHVTKVDGVTAVMHCSHEKCFEFNGNIYLVK